VPRDGHKATAGAPAPALTDQAIAKIKDLILAGEFQAGSKLPREQDLARKLGLSRNSLREAVRALALIGVLNTRVGDGTYVTSLDAELLMTGMGLVGELLDGKTLLEAHQVRRILEPVATSLAATRLTEADFAELADILERMERADRTQAFVDADNDFHAVINNATGNATLASLIQNLSGGMMRARLWRTLTEEEAVEVTKQRHRDIYLALRAGDAQRASAADLIHLAEGERWLELMLERGELSRPHAVHRPGNPAGGSGT
jgi:GntR family transcriptional regulator, transcriptional repressor for pyruvate dehydrogenase complex